MTTIGKLIELLSSYPSDMIVKSELGEDFIHMVNGKNGLTISTNRPVGICNISGGYVYQNNEDYFSTDLNRYVNEKEMSKI